MALDLNNAHYLAKLDEDPYSAALLSEIERYKASLMKMIDIGIAEMTGEQLFYTEGCIKACNRILLIQKEARDFLEEQNLA
jgi:hypothetical protein